MKTISFTKMHGLGNDFMIIDATVQAIDTTQLPITKWADRHLGIGFDQLLLIEPSEKATAFCRIFNADGSEAEQCGNGLRCVARYLHENKKVAAKQFNIATKAGNFAILLHDHENIEIILAAPQIEKKLLAMTLPSQTLEVAIIATGNPHAIVKVDNVKNLPIDLWGNEIASHSYFANGANVGFMQIIHAQHAKLRTLERGVGETYACGSNACAAAVAGIVNGWLHSPVQLEFKLGMLTIKWEGEGKPIHMIGPAARVFEGNVFLQPRI